jgi:hypothetical protein
VTDDYFFSERESGSILRVDDQCDDAAWGGIVALVRSQLASQCFALAFPFNCEDKGRGVIATDEGSFWLALFASVPDAPDQLNVRVVPSAPVAMDLLEFASHHVAEATEADFHDFYRHHHLEFNKVRGLANLRQKTNLIFRRAGLAFEMDAVGLVNRLAPPVIRERIERSLPSTGRPSLDERLARAIEKYRSPDPVDRREALEKLWDAWEEIKTLRGKKPVGIASLISDVARDADYAAALDQDARALTDLGNQFQIRHTEVGRIPIESAAQVDYLFGRLFNLLWLLLLPAAAAED